MTRFNQLEHQAANLPLRDWTVDNLNKTLAAENIHMDEDFINVSQGLYKFFHTLEAQVSGGVLLIKAQFDLGVQIEKVFQQLEVAGVKVLK